MFKIIGIETVPPPLDYALGYPETPEGLSPLDIEVAKAKKERYNSCMRLLSAQDINRRYMFYREYSFDKNGKLVKGDSLLPEDFYLPKTDDEDKNHENKHENKDGKKQARELSDIGNGASALNW